MEQIPEFIAEVMRVNLVNWSFFIPKFSGACVLFRYK